MSVGTSPVVSVVMSVYNDESCVRRAIGGIVDQTYDDWELVVINDGSVDGTSEIADRFAANDDRIRVIEQENQGLTRSLIRGCAESRGQYIARQDADDWSHPDRLAKQVELLDAHPGVEFVSCFTRYVGPAGEQLEVLKRPSDPHEATQRLLNEREGPPAHGSMMFRRELYEQVGGYRPEFYFGQDSDLWLRMAERSLIGYVGSVLYEHQRSPNSITGAMRSVQQRFGQLSHECRKARVEGSSEDEVLAEARVLTREVRRRRAEGDAAPDAARMQYLIGSQLAQMGDRRAARYLWPVLKQQPWHWKAWVRLLESRIRMPAAFRQDVS